MGMAVKGITEHRVIAKGMNLLLDDAALAAEDRAAAQRLRNRADLGLSRVKRRRASRAAKRQADVLGDSHA